MDNNTPDRKPSFFESDFADVKNYMITDLIIPKIKEIILDTLNMLFWGTSGNYRGGSYSNRPTNYNGMYRNNLNASSQPVTRDNLYSRRSDILELVVFQDILDAQKTRDEIFTLINDYGHASVADFYQIASKYVKPGVMINSSDHKFGWKKLDDVRIVHCGRGYEVVLPQPIQL